LELGFIGVGPSRIASDGELYRGWNGSRFALLSGYDFIPISLGALGDLAIGILAGGALSAAVYANTPLAYAYPSLLFVPRAELRIKGDRDSAPWLAIPAELMFRAGTHTIAPGLSVGWLYRFGGKR
jgi:hypothetical protein